MDFPLVASAVADGLTISSAASSTTDTSARRLRPASSDVELCGWQSLQLHRRWDSSKITRYRCSCWCWKPYDWRWRRLATASTGARRRLDPARLRAVSPAPLLTPGPLLIHHRLLNTCDTLICKWPIHVMPTELFLPKMGYRKVSEGLLSL